MKHGLVESGSEVRLQAFDSLTRINSFFQQYERGKEATDQCVTSLDEIEGEPINVDACEGIMQLVVGEPGGAECVYLVHPLPSANSFLSELAGLCLNVYDVRLKDEVPACGMNWPLDLKNITSYLRVRSPLSLHFLHYSLTPTETRCCGCSPRTGQVGGLG